MLRIGKFSKLSRVSVKALRLYANLSLLNPVHIDRFTGYRYYAEEQLKQAHLILVLRRLDMPLATVRQVLQADSPAAARALVDGYWREVELQVAERRKVLGYVHEYLQGKERTMTYTIRTRPAPEQQVLSIQQTVSIQELVGYIDRSIAALQAHVRAQGGQPAGAPFGIYHGQANEDSQGPVEICLPVEGAFKPGSGIQLRQLGATQVASVTLTERQSEFPAILGAYDAIFDWVKQNGHKTVEPPREIYLTEQKTVGPEAPFIESAWPSCNLPAASGTLP